jgi:O-glycosyl hydrolase
MRHLLRFTLHEQRFTLRSRSAYHASRLRLWASLGMLLSGTALAAAPWIPPNSFTAPLTDHGFPSS